mgnify:FL=1|tara:strand:- start:45 stop:1100 length:1056 start_codon:yes stop_codon:yes gene_type:complete
MATPSEYFDNADISKIPVPDWEHLDVISPSSNATVKLTWDKIYIDDIDGNITKEEPHTAEEIEALRLSFAAKVDEKEFPPAVIYRGKEYAKPWKLVYGYGRCEALRLLNTKGWFFTNLEGTEDALEDVQAQENEMLPKRINEEVDMRKFLIQKVTDGKIEKTEAAIRAKFQKVYPYRRKETINRVVPQVLKELGVKLPYILYTSKSKVEDWIENHSKIDYVIGEKFDHERDMYGVQMKEGYDWRVVMNAMQTYVQTGKKTYVICHCGAPTKAANFSDKRKKIVDRFNHWENVYRKMGVTTWPIVLMGALPQDRKNENLKVLVPMGDNAKIVLEDTDDIDDALEIESSFAAA